MCQLVKCGLFHVQAFHSLHSCNVAGLSQVNHPGVVFRQRYLRSAEFHSLVECESNSRGLAYANFAAFLFGSVSR